MSHFIQMINLETEHTVCELHPFLGVSFNGSVLSGMVLSEKMLAFDLGCNQGF